MHLHSSCNASMSSSKLGIIMGSNPSWVLYEVCVFILFGGAVQKGSSHLHFFIIESSGKINRVGAEAWLLNFRLFEYYFVQEHSKSASCLTVRIMHLHSSIQCFEILGYCGWVRIPLSYCNCKNGLWSFLAKKRIFFTGDASANLWKDQLHWVFTVKAKIV